MHLVKAVLPCHLMPLCEKHKSAEGSSLGLVHSFGQEGFVRSSARSSARCE